MSEEFHSNNERSSPLIYIYIWCRLEQKWELYIRNIDWTSNMKYNIIVLHKFFDCNIIHIFVRICWFIYRTKYCNNIRQPKLKWQLWKYSDNAYTINWSNFTECMSNKKDNTLFYWAVKSKFEVYLKKKKTGQFA